MVSRALFTSNSYEWATPQALFDTLNAEFKFTLDPCCNHENAKCDRHYTIEDNGLSQSWANERVFMNPPYGRQIKKWMKKAWEESQSGALVVCLVPARTDTYWWHDYAMQVWPHGIRLLKGRLYFNDGDGRATFPSAVVIFNPITKEES
jgi:site-specific DNA-methyltransferase (adenine-specific)